MSSSDIGTSDFDLLLASARERLGDPGEWTRHDRFHASLALAVVDAIQSTAAEYGKSVRAVERYRAYRSAQGQSEVTDGARDLLHTFEQVGGALNWSGKIGNYKRPYSDTQSLRANTIQDAAERLHGLGIDSAQDLRAVATDPARYQAARDAWMSVSSATDEINWIYLLMLVGVPWVQPQALSSQFVAGALGARSADAGGGAGAGDGADAVAEPGTGPGENHALLGAVAEAMGVSLVELEHAIWRWELNLTHPAEIPVDRTRMLAAA